jgi:phosphate transport system permease protein
MANVPVVIFQYAMSPYDSWHALAWAGAFTVTAFVLMLSVATRILLKPRKHV